MEEFAGMTVNERLYVSGRLDAFDKAVAKKKVNEVILILKQVELSDSNIEDILKSLDLVRT